MNFRQPNELKSALVKMAEFSRNGPLTSGIETLDSLLGGGFHPDDVNLLFGDMKYITRVLQTIALISLLPKSFGGVGASRVLYVDGENRFDPYLISALAQGVKMDPKTALSQISVARAFNWNHMVEIVSEKVPCERADVLIVTGITNMMNLDENLLKSVSDLKKMIGGITKARPHMVYIFLSAKMHNKSFSKPNGGNVLTHFASTIIKVVDSERHTEFSLMQHLTRKSTMVREWKDFTTIEQKLAARKTLTLDYYLNDWDDSISESANVETKIVKHTQSIAKTIDRNTLDYFIN